LDIYVNLRIRVKSIVRIKYSCMHIVLQLYYFILIGILSTSVYRYVILYFQDFIFERLGRETE